MGHSLPLAGAGEKKEAGAEQGQALGARKWGQGEGEEGVDARGGRGRGGGLGGGQATETEEGDRVRGVAPDSDQGMRGGLAGRGGPQEPDGQEVRHGDVGEGPGVNLDGMGEGVEPSGRAGGGAGGRVDDVEGASAGWGQQPGRTRAGGRERAAPGRAGTASTLGKRRRRPAPPGIDQAEVRVAGGSKAVRPRRTHYPDAFSKRGVHVRESRNVQAGKVQDRARRPIVNAQDPFHAHGQVPPMQAPGCRLQGPREGWGEGGRVEGPLIDRCRQRGRGGGRGRGKLPLLSR